MRKNHPATVKFQVALAALTGQPITDICQQFEVSASLVHKWKKQLKGEGVSIFQDNKKSPTDSYQDVTKLQQIIGKLTIEMEFLKKTLEC